MKPGSALFCKRKCLAAAVVVLLAVCLCGCSSRMSYPKEGTQSELYHGSQQPAAPEPVERISLDKYAYGQLEKNTQTVYDEILDAIMGHKEKISVSTLDTEVLEQAFYSVRADYGGLFWVDGYTYTEYSSGDQVTGLEFAPHYTMTYDKREELQQAVDTAAEHLLGGISSEDADYQKARFVYDTLINTVAYNPEAENSQNILSVFLNQETVCQGYACAVQFLFERLGIPSVIVTGTAAGQAHAWNMVMLDGNYYYMDVTWGNSAYQNEGSGRQGYINYSYFAMTSEELLFTHEPDNFLLLPECTQREDSYFVQEGRYFTDWYPQEIGYVLSGLKDGIVQIKFADAALYRKAQEYFIEQQNIRDYYAVENSFYYVTDDELCVLTFMNGS